MTQDVRVEIYGQTYSLRTDLDPDYIERLAAVVDARMNALSHQTGTVDTRRLAVLSALNLADEIAQLQKSLESAPALPDDAAQRLDRCIRVLDTALAGVVHGQQSSGRSAG